MKYCPSCGKPEENDYLVFCSGCGAQFPVPQAQPVGPAQPINPNMVQTVYTPTATLPTDQHPRTALKISGFICGIASLLIPFYILITDLYTFIEDSLPVVYLIAAAVGIVGVILSAIGIQNGGKLRGLGIAGLIVSSIAVLVTLLMFGCCVCTAADGHHYNYRAF